MKSFVNRITIALIIFALASVAAFAKTRKDTVTFPSNIKVGSTLVKQGTYELKFNEETNELSILKNGKVIAKASTRTEKGTKAKGTQFVSSVGAGDERQLLSVTFSGSDQKVVVSGSEAASNNN